MLDACQKEIDGFFGRYARKEGITIAEAKKRVSKLDIEAYERKAKKYVKEKDFSEKANEEMRLYNLTMKTNRLEMLKANLGLELVSGHDELEKFMRGILRGRTEEELERQAGILGKTIRNNARMAEVIPNASFHNATFSDRIWMYQELLKSDLSKLLQSGLIQGKNPRLLARELQKKFGESEYNSERLMRTELARVQTEAQKQSFERNGFKQYTFIVNGGCCPLCEAAAKKNGGHYYIKDMMPGENAPPMHPNCRCSVAAYENSEDYEAWLDFLDKGGTTEEWNSIRKKAKQDIVKQFKTVYTGGIPRKWKRIEFSDDDAVKNANPHYSSRKAEYRNNCPNCVNAYEMRKRGYDVIAKASGKNHYLNRFPEQAWEDVKPISTTGKGFDDIVKAVSAGGDGSRYEVSVKIKGTANNGHVFVAENKKGKVVFSDPQSGSTIKRTFFDYVQDNETRFWRIDNAKPSNRCIASCESR